MEAIAAPVAQERTSEELLAERERLHLECDANQRRQGSLILRGGN